MLILATAVDPLLPSITFVVVAVVLGVMLSTFMKRVTLSAVVASAVVVTAFVTTKEYLPLEFAVYAQDMVYEPLIRDHFVSSPGEGIASALFHFGVPSLIVAGLMRCPRNPLTKSEMEGNDVEGVRQAECPGSG